MLRIVKKISKTKSAIQLFSLPIIIATGFFIFYGFLGRGTSNGTDYKYTANPENASHSINSNFGELPLGFEVNAGQTDEHVHFLSRGPGYTLFLTPGEAVLSLRRKDLQTPPATLRIRLDGANEKPEITGQNELAGKSNYFSGNDPDGWKSGVSSFSRVLYRDVYPGIDQVFYGNGKQLEYDFIVAPRVGGGNSALGAKNIALAFEGASDLRISAEGDLILNIGGEELRQQKLIVYQEIDGERREIAASYSIRNPSSDVRDRRVGFEIGEYDQSKPLIIDPVLVYSTYLGGTGFDQGYAIAVDSSGNTYVTGRTGTTNFPTTTGAFDTTFNGSTDAFVTKINAAGNALIYSTYIGGAIGNGIAVDSSGNAYVTGESGPPNFPTTQGAFQTSPYGFDAFILKLNPSGSALIYSSRFGGNFDDFGRGIAVDSSGSAYITGWTVCRAPTCTFPVVNAFQPNYGGGYNDGFVTKMNPAGTALVYSTYLGGGQIINATEDWGEGIAVDGTGSAYVTGYTYSPDFPVTAGAYDTERCGLDAFITKFAPAGNTLVYSTFLGGCGREQGQDIAIDSAGNAYVAGITESQNFPTTPGAFQTTGSFDAFVTKVNPNGSGLVYSTYLGGSDDVDRAWGIAVDSVGNAYVAGDTKSNDFPVADAVQSNYGGGLTDAFVSKLNPTGTAVVYSTYLGGGFSDEGRGIDVTGNGSAYATGYSASDDFPITTGAFQMQNAGGVEHFDDAFVVAIQGQRARSGRAFDFDGDGRADVSVFRPSDGYWYLQNSTTGFTAQRFGLAADKIAPADFDGDGRTDIAVFRDGVWYWLQSSDGSFRALNFGLTGDLPVAADYTGDGRAEAAVYRGGMWFTLNLVNDEFKAVQFGNNTDKPVPADFDGDGRTDNAVYRNGTWLWLKSSDGTFTGVQFGLATDTPTVGDYDGDSKADPAVYRAGDWFILRSTQGFFTTHFGMASDIPVAADYEGDGKTDVAVFRDGTWYQLRSQENFWAMQFGLSNDKPVPAAFLP
jgi:hypothetical protein